MTVWKLFLDEPPGDEVRASEAVTVALSPEPNAADNVALSEAVGAELAVAPVEVFDNVALSEAVGAELAVAPVEVFDNVALSEAVGGALSDLPPPEPNVNDLVALSEFTALEIEAGEGPVGSVCYGHSTGVTQNNALTLSGNWGGTGAIVGTGDAERLVIGPGEYMEIDDPVNIVGTVRLGQNEYLAGSGGPAVIKYKNGVDVSACIADTWNDYATPFVSLGWVLVRLERS